MKKITTCILLSALCWGFAACDTDYEPLELQLPYQYDEQYYINLRDYKSTMSERSLCFVWFTDYENPSSPGNRFSVLPDSVDICSLWGGYPKPGTIAYEEMWEMRRRKGTILVAPTIIRIMEDKNYENFGLTEEDMIDQKTTLDPDGVYPDWCILYGNHLLQQMWDNGIDGLDLDYEPEAEAEQKYGIYEERMTLFVQYLGQFIGPMGADPTKLLIIDGHKPPVECEPYINYYIVQNYGGHSCYSVGGYPWEKCVYTENIGKYWIDGGGLLDQAAYQPSEGYKGGFGAFYVQRDYHTSDSGADKDKQMPYGYLRRAIQLQNPAVTK